MAIGCGVRIRVRVGVVSLGCGVSALVRFSLALRLRCPTPSASASEPDNVLAPERSTAVGAGSVVEAGAPLGEIIKVDLKYANSSAVRCQATACVIQRMCTRVTHKRSPFPRFHR